MNTVSSYGSNIKLIFKIFIFFEKSCIYLPKNTTTIIKRKSSVPPKRNQSFFYTESSQDRDNDFFSQTQTQFSNTTNNFNSFYKIDQKESNYVTELYKEYQSFLDFNS